MAAEHLVDISRLDCLNAVYLAAIQDPAAGDDPTEMAFTLTCAGTVDVQTWGQLSLLTPTSADLRAIADALIWLADLADTQAATNAEDPADALA